MASNSCGRFSEEVGITVDHIAHSVTGLVTDIKVGLLFEIRKLCDSDEDCAQHLIAVTGMDEASCNLASLKQKIHRTVEKVKKDIRNKSKGLEAIFQLKQIDDTRKVELENHKLKRSLNSFADEHHAVLSEYKILKENLSEIIDNYEKSNSSKLSSLEELNSEQTHQMDQMIDQITQAKDKLNSASISKRNLSKKIKRKDEQIHQLALELSFSKEDIPSDGAKDDSERPIFGLEENKDQLQQEIYYLRKQIKRLREDKFYVQETIAEEKVETSLEIQKLKDQIRHLENQNNFLEKDLVPMFDEIEHRYSNKVRSCCMTLVSEGNVSANKVGKVISTVLETLTGIEPDRLPSKALLSSTIIPEGKVVACKQVAEKMLEGYEPSQNIGNVLHQDATTKFSEHFEGMQVTLRSGENLSIGLAKVGGGSADTYVEVFKNIIDDLAMAYSGQTSKNEDERAKLITSIKSFLSDQCATNPVFNRAIEDMRSKLLPGQIADFDHLSEIEQKRISQMGQFACRLHLLANFGTAADKALKMFEDSIIRSGKNHHSFSFSEESGTFRLARTSAKALTKRGSDQCGIGAYWESFLEGQNKQNYLLTFHGHRINIAFYNCAAVYYHKEDIVNILKDFDKPNNLLLAVMFDIQQKAFIAGSRAMGIFYELVTAPFWTLLEKEGSILDLNDDIHQMKLTLSQWAEDGLEPLNGSPMFPNSKIDHHSRFHDCLFAPSNDEEFDSFTQIALELLSSQLLIILERQAASQLPNGKYFDPSKDLKEVASNVPKTNTISERDMAILDNLLRAKPSASALCLETILLWTRNKPSAWLRSLTETERDQLLNDARKMGPQFKQIFKERQKVVKDQISKRLLEKQMKKVKDDQTKITNKLALSTEIVKYGGPWSVEDIGDKIEELSRLSSNPEKSVRDALLSQIKFHRTVLCSSGPKEIFQESVKKRKYTNDELADNLKGILLLNTGPSSSELENKDLLYYKTSSEIQDSLKTKKEALYSKLAAERKQRLINQVKELLPAYIENPELLIQKRVSHKCLETGREVQWYSGKVTGIKSLKPDVIKSLFFISYDECPDDEWFFPLLIDIKNGDLIVYK